MNNYKNSGFLLFLFQQKTTIIIIIILSVIKNYVKGSNMDDSRDQIEKSLIFLKSLFPPDQMCGIWCYDKEGTLLSSTYAGTERSILNKVIIRLGAMDKILELSKAANKTNEPRLVGSSIGLQWAAIFTTERKSNQIFVIGPVFYTSISENQIIMGLPQNLADKIMNVIKQIRTMPTTVFLNYVTNVFNALTGQNLSTMELFLEKEENALLTAQGPDKRDREKVYMSEQQMLKMVREGNINYKNALMTSMNLSPGVPIQGKDPLRQAKTSLVVLETLVCRAAMEGGLNPQIAYPLGDSYLKAIEDSEDIGELFSLANAMFHDFVYRVHRTKNDKGYSAAVQKCCDFIEVSQDRRITASDLSSLCGYSEYYITEKFKKETGLSLNQYIKISKVEKAKSILSTTSMTIKEVASQLAFNTTNYFIQCFKEVTGLTPTQYRKEIKE